MIALKVVVPCFNCFDWLVRCLESIAAQDYPNYTVCVVDDASTDPRMRPEIRRFCSERGWKWRFEPINRGSLHSIAVGIQELSPSDDEVIVTVDGDDWLVGTDVFSYLAEVYEGGGVDLTYGHFRYDPDEQIAAQVPFIPGHPRALQGPILPAPLRTFRAFLWRAILPQDLQDGQGEYLRYATDWAFMLPMMEMAGHRIKRIEKVLYVYNYGNEINEWKIAYGSQKAVQLYVLSKPSYAVHPRCESGERERSRKAEMSLESPCESHHKR